MPASYVLGKNNSVTMVRDTTRERVLVTTFSNTAARDIVTATTTTTDKPQTQNITLSERQILGNLRSMFVVWIELQG